MAEAGTGKALQFIEDIEQSILRQWGKSVEPKWIEGPFEVGVAVDHERLMGHALFALKRARYIVEHSDTADSDSRSGAALCIGVACMAALACGVVAEVPMPPLKFYPAINLPSVAPSR